jgi:hypothetical protein
MVRRFLPMLLFPGLASGTSMASDPPVSFSFSAAREADGVVVVTAHAAVQEGWYLYATELPRDD